MIAILEVLVVVFVVLDASCWYDWRFRGGPTRSTLGEADILVSMLGYTFAYRLTFLLAYMLACMLADMLGRLRANILETFGKLIAGGLDGQKFPISLVNYQM